MSRLFSLRTILGVLLCVFVGTAAAQVPNQTGAPNKGTGVNNANANANATKALPNQRALQRPLDPRALAAASAATKSVGQPSWVPLPELQEKRLMEILTYWEWQTSQVERYRCKFTRWEYDPIRLPNEPDVAATISKGSIQYASPDKGLFKVEQVWDIAMVTEKVIDKQTGKEQQVTRPSIVDGKPQHVARKEVFDEHWICDGKSIFEVNGRNQQIIERPLPPGMQGKQITQGPLPFLFGAKVDTIRQQYWIREVTPQPIPKKFMLEAIPRRAQEAADFREIRIVIDEQEFLPEAILLFHRSGGRSNYEFQNREKNWSIIPEKLNPFHQQFFRPQVKPGWKLVTEPFGADPAAAGPAPAIGGNAIPPRQAVRQLPAAGTKR